MSARKTNRKANLQALVDPSVDSELPFGSELVSFVDAAVERDPKTMALARSRLLRVAGEAATVRAATVCGNFQMMNRLLDAIGVRTQRAGMMLAAELGLTVPNHLHP